MHALTSASVLATTVFSVANALSPHVSSGGLVNTYYGQRGDDLEALCSDDSVDIVPIAFVNYFAKSEGEFNKMDFGPNVWADDEWVDEKGDKLKNVYNNAHEIVKHMDTCQKNGKKVLISLGGDEKKSDCKLTSTEQATNVAAQLWTMFGPVNPAWKGPRPFGQSVVDGFDFDIEGSQASQYHADLAKALALLFETDKSKTYLLTAAPQCPENDGLLPALQTGLFDYVFIQFYNNYCGAYTYGTDDDQFTKSWSSWSNAMAAYSKTKIFLGLPAGPGSTEDAKYQLDAEAATAVIKSVLKTPNFGGVSLWDYSLAAKFNNYQKVVKKALYGKPPVYTTTTSATTTTTTTEGHGHGGKPTTTVETTTTTTEGHGHGGKPTTTAETTTTTTKGHGHGGEPTTTAASTTTDASHWSDFPVPTSKTTTTTSKPVKPTSSESEHEPWSDVPEPTSKTTTSKPVEPTTTVHDSWSDVPEPTSKTTTSKPVKPTTTVHDTWSDVPEPTSKPTKPTKVHTEHEEATVTVTAKWSDYPGNNPAAPVTKYETVYVDEWVTECACVPEPTPAVPAPGKPAAPPPPPAPPVATTIVPSKPVGTYTPTKPVVAQFTGAATQQLPGAVLSVTACVAVAIVGLFL